MALSKELEYKYEEIPVRDLTLDLRVNPRDASVAWAKEQLDTGYNRNLLGTFIVSERILEDDGRQWVLLDGANRKKLMEMAADEQHPVHCQVFTGLTLAQEAQVAAEYNDRRLWAPQRMFQVLCTMGDPTALRIQALLDKGGWRVDTVSLPGVIRGVQPFHRLIKTAGMMAAAEVHATKGTERYKAALLNGEDDAFRALEMAIEVYNNAFQDKPGGYAADIMYAIALVLIKNGEQVDLARLTQNLRDNSKGQRSFKNDASSLKDTMRFSLVDGFAFLLVMYYNTGLKSNAKAALPGWVKTAR